MINFDGYNSNLNSPLWYLQTLSAHHVLVVMDFILILQSPRYILEPFLWRGKSLFFKYFI